MSHIAVIGAEEIKTAIDESRSARESLVVAMGNYNKSSRPTVPYDGSIGHTHQPWISMTHALLIALKDATSNMSAVTASLNDLH